MLPLLLLLLYDVEVGPQSRFEFYFIVVVEIVLPMCQCCTLVGTNKESQRRRHQPVAAVEWYVISDSTHITSSMYHGMLSQSVLLPVL